MHKHHEGKCLSTSSAGLNVMSWGLHWGPGEGEEAVLWGVVGEKQDSVTGDFSVRLLWQQDP